MHNPTNYEVLVVEDEDTTCHLVAHVRRDAGYRVAEVVDSNQGLEALLSDLTSFDMVVLDMQMPTMNGLQVARAMRRDERVSDTPLLAVTALAHANDLTRILRAGCDAYLAKPFAMDEVCEIVAGLLEARGQGTPRQPLLGQAGRSVLPAFANRLGRASRPRIAPAVGPTERRCAGGLR